MQEQAFALLYQDKKLLENTKVPIITVSASFKEDLKGFHGEPEMIKFKTSFFLEHTTQWH
jgi:hypothetical protein